LKRSGTSGAEELPMSETTSSREFNVKILRQDGPNQSSYWQRFAVPYESDMNVISVLQKIAAMSRTADGKAVSPVAWDCNCLEEVCGACTMVINGKVRQACTALVDRLLEDNPEVIELSPMTKFPVIRDLMVDRSRMFATLKKIKAWLPIDSYHNLGEAARQSQDNQEISYVLSQCMTCGCCLEACPQYLKIELARHEGESDDDFHARETEVFFRSFMGASAIAQVDLYNNNPIGQMNSRDRLDALVSQNCVQVCPKEIPLTTSIARMGRAATVHTLKQWFDR
jgi:succinate dehydrogenase iron-sulfur subunit